jgi:hypothetical protein
MVFDLMTLITFKRLEVDWMVGLGFVLVDDGKMSDGTCS